MPDDACNAVKQDLKEGTHIYYSGSLPIYIAYQDKFQGGNVYLILRDPLREPVQTVNGSILYTKRSCKIEIVATNPTIRDNIYLDIIEILIATNRGYKIKRAKDNPIHKNQNRNMLEVSMLL